MPGYPHKAKRAKVRRMLRLIRWQEAPDRAVARAADVSKNLVTAVRRSMIVAGEHPPRNYRPGGSVRGGMVYGTDGCPTTELGYLRQSARGRGRKVLGLLEELLAVLRGQG